MPKRKQVTSTSTSSKPPKAKTGKNTKSSPEFSDEVLNFGKVYGWALYCGAYYWNFHDDSGCWYDTCQDQSHTEGNWTALYKPGKGMKEYEDHKFTVLFLRKAGTPPITEELYDEVQSIVEYVDRLYLQSYNDLRRVMKGKWSDPIQEGTIEEIAKIVSPMKFERNNIRMSMLIRGWEKNKCYDQWTPRRLAKWLGFYEGDDLEYEDMIDDSGNYICSTCNGVPQDFYWFTEDAVEAEI